MQKNKEKFLFPLVVSLRKLILELNFYSQKLYVQTSVKISLEVKVKARVS